MIQRDVNQVSQRLLHAALWWCWGSVEEEGSSKGSSGDSVGLDDGTGRRLLEEGSRAETETTGLGEDQEEKLPMDQR